MIILTFRGGKSAYITLTVLSDCKTQMNCCQRLLPPMEVMNFIEQVFINLNFKLVKGLKKNSVVEVIAKSHTTTWMKNKRLGLIS